MAGSAQREARLLSNADLRELKIKKRAVDQKEETCSVDRKKQTCYDVVCMLVMLSVASGMIRYLPSPLPPGMATTKNHHKNIKMLN